MAKCGEKTEVYSRVCGYFRPISNWNRGKLEEFRQRKTFKVPQLTKSRSDYRTRFAGHEVTVKPASREGEVKNVNTEF
jgi:hypothetical protein